MQIERTTPIQHIVIFDDTKQAAILPALAAIACLGILVCAAPSIYNFLSKHFFTCEPSFPKAKIKEIPLSPAPSPSRNLNSQTPQIPSVSAIKSPIHEETLVQQDSPLSKPITTSRTQTKCSAHAISNHIFTHALKMESHSSLEEKDCLYKGDLSTELSLLEERLTLHKDLIDYIQSAQGRDKRVALAILLTLLGIKPAYIIETKEIPLKLKKILANKSKSLTIKKFDFCPTKVLYDNQRIPYTQEDEKKFKVVDTLCITNEAPLESFNPRRFLHPLQDSNMTLSEATLYCFLKQGNQQTDQMLSYLLGFGPSWESYACRSQTTFNPKNSVFTSAHYEELGQVFPTGTNLSSEQIGYVFHRLFPYYNVDIKHNLYHPSDPITQLLSSTGTDQVFNGISARTEYFQKSYTLKKWLSETLSVARTI